MLLTLLVSCEEPPPIAQRNWVGEADVIVDEQFSGTEVRIVLGDDATVLCEERYELFAGEPDPIGDCPDCTFAFQVEVSDIEALRGEWCSDLGVEAQELDRRGKIGIGYYADEGLMAHYYMPYAWDKAMDSTTTWSGDDSEGTLTWDWGYGHREYALPD